jgi:hypothetical protein
MELLRHGSKMAVARHLLRDKRESKKGISQISCKDRKVELSKLLIGQVEFLKINLKENVESIGIHVMV